MMRFYDSLKQWLLVRVQDVVGSMKSSIYLGCRYWRLGHCYVEAATEHYYEDALARVGMTSCKSVVTPGVNDVASNFLPEEARLSFEGLLLSIEAGCQRNSMFLTRISHLLIVSIRIAVLK